MTITTRIRNFITTCILLVWVVIPSADVLRLSITAKPQVGLHEGVFVEAHVPRSEHNRQIHMEIDGPVFKGFDEQLDGEDARVIYTLRMDRLPDGAYQATVGVLKDDGKWEQQHALFCRGEGCASSEYEN
jgi:hypothetical protein